MQRARDSCVSSNTEHHDVRTLTATNRATITTGVITRPNRRCVWTKNRPSVARRFFFSFDDLIGLTIESYAKRDGTRLYQLNSLQSTSRRGYTAVPVLLQSWSTYTGRIIRYRIRIDNKRGYTLHVVYCTMPVRCVLYPEKVKFELTKIHFRTGVHKAPVAPLVLPRSADRFADGPRSCTTVKVCAVRLAVRKIAEKRVESRADQFFVVPMALSSLKRPSTHG